MLTYPDPLRRPVLITRWARLFAVHVLATSGVGAQRIAPPTPTRASCTTRQPAVAVQQTIAVNYAVNRFDAWIANQDWARVGFESWGRNIKLGWEWDENSFATNMFMHPFHGAAYFNTGRTHCLSYWESVPLVFLGSWTWEYFAETYRPSLNDFFMTSFGGIALGEITHRVAATIRDEQADGTGRILREIAATLVNPVTGLNRLYHGDWTRIGDNPSEHDPGAFILRFDVGLRSLSEDATRFKSGAPFMQLGIGYGDPFTTPYKAPFDVFSLEAQVALDGSGLNVLQGAGRLYEMPLPGWGRGIRHALTVSHRYDYLSKPVYSFGAQSIEVGVLSNFPLSAQTALRTRVGGDVVVLGAIGSPHGGFGERDYDFGPGAGATLELSLLRRGRQVVTLTNRAEYLHTVSGPAGDHLIAFSTLEANLGIGDRWGVGIRLNGDSRTSKYLDAETDTKQFGEAQLVVSWITRSRPAVTP
ncbi:MAG TPA: DUF3943 domain-containing protein [Gemmatimonadales bacterium]|nr:DUF3943 domain-containing protein [Gemmatimonadales bacterium]